MKFSLLLLCFFLVINSFAQNVTIKGNAPTYIGKEIYLYKHSNFITKNKIILDKIIVDNNGNYSFSLKTSKINKCYIHTDYFNIYLYVYPDMNIKIEIPKYKERPNDIFFKTVELPAIIKNASAHELNNLILSFDKEYAIICSENVSLYNITTKKTIDSINQIIDKKFQSDKTYFNNYKKYSLASTYFFNNPETQDVLKCFLNKPFLQNNSAYTNLFAKVFDKYFSFNKLRKEEKQQADILYKKLEEKLEKKGITNKLIQEYIIVYNLFNAAYNPIFDKNLIIKTIEYSHKVSICKNIKIITQNVLKDITYLSKGYPIPTFSGMTINGKLLKSIEIKDKYLYLMFFDGKIPAYSNNYLEEISKFTNKYNYLRTIILCDKTQKEKCTSELGKHNLLNNAIFCENFNDLKQKFKVLACPSFFMTDRNKNIIQAHTIKPSNNLNRTLNSIYIKELKLGHIKPHRMFN